jgi:hypothetical protein
MAECGAVKRAIVKLSVMKPWCLFLGCWVLAISACNWGLPHNTPPNITKDTLLYAYKTIIENKPGCTAISGDSCLLLKVRYPVFKNRPAINDSIQQLISSGFLSNKHSTSLSQAARQYLDYYNTTLKDAGLAKPETVLLNVAIVRQDSSLLTIDLKNRSPHKVNGTAIEFDYYTNFDVKQNRILHLKDILIKNYVTALNKIGDTIFRKEEKLSATESLTNRYNFANGVFDLYDNFLITPTGLRFLYNPMDIKSNNTETEVLIPYSKIKSLLLPHTVISQYIK